MSLRHALLGLLADQPASGYDLARRFERVLQRYAWHAQHSQIYPELSRLAADGLVTVIGEGARGRRTFAITDAGRSELERWLLNPPEQFMVRNEFVLRLFLLSTLDADRARPLLRSVVEQSALELANLRTVVEQVDAGLEPGAPLPFGRLAAEFGLRSFQAIHEWALWALDQLDRS